MESGTSQQRVSRAARWGLWLGPLTALVIFVFPVPSGNHAARDTAAVGPLMAVYWVVGTIPLAITSLIPLETFPLLAILAIKWASAAYASPMIHLFPGGYMMATGIDRWGLHRRPARTIFARISMRPASLAGGFHSNRVFGFYDRAILQGAAP